MSFKSIAKIKNLKNKVVLLRLDLNVTWRGAALTADESFRLEAIVPTIEFLRKHRAKVVLLSHLGRPQGRMNLDLSLAPVIRYLSKILGRNIRFVPQLGGPAVKKQIKKMRGGEIIALENLRFDPREESNDNGLAKELASLGDLYVNDAFAVCHRAAASVVAITKYLPCYAGLLLEKEVKNLSKVLRQPKRPLVIIMGGLKFETKIPVIKKLLSLTSKIMLGGGLSSTVLAAAGYGVGGSIIDKDYFSQAAKLFKNKKLMLPLDVIVGSKKNLKNYRRVILPGRPIQLVNESEAIYDIGPATIASWALEIKKAASIIWNGPVGYFESPPFDAGTRSIAILVGSRSSGRAYGVVGGGETVAALMASQMFKYVDHVSTGGGAMLEFLAGKQLPGLLTLEK